MGRAVSCQLERDLVDVDCLPIPLQVLDLTLDLAVFFPGHDHIPRLCALEHDALPAPRPEHLFDLVERASVRPPPPRSHPLCPPSPNNKVWGASRLHRVGGPE